jgi:hypothetical protein
VGDWSSEARFDREMAVDVLRIVIARPRGKALDVIG